MQEKDVAAALRQVRRGEYPRPRDVLPEVPPALEAICLKAMAHRAGDRYDSAPGAGARRGALAGRRAGLGVAGAGVAAPAAPGESPPDGGQLGGGGDPGGGGDGRLSRVRGAGGARPPPGRGGGPGGCALDGRHPVGAADRRPARGRSGPRPGSATCPAVGPGDGRRPGRGGDDAAAGGPVAGGFPARSGRVGRVNPRGGSGHLRRPVALRCTAVHGGGDRIEAGAGFRSDQRRGSEAVRAAGGRPGRLAPVARLRGADRGQAGACQSLGDRGLAAGFPADRRGTGRAAAGDLRRSLRSRAPGAGVRSAAGLRLAAGPRRSAGGPGRIARRRRSRPVPSDPGPPGHARIGPAPWRRSSR